LAEKLSDDQKSRFIIGVGGNNTSECIELATNSAHRGFKKIMITAPYYNKPTQDGLYLHFTKIAHEHLKVCPESKVVLYNVPGRSVVNINPNTVLRVYNECKNVVAIKEASGNMSQVISIRTLVPDIKVYSGDDGLVVPIMSIGGVGLISVVSNVFPNQVYQVLKLCMESNYTAAFREYTKLHQFTEAMFCESNPVPVKYVLKLTGLYKSDECRLPLAPLSEENASMVTKVYNTTLTNIYT